jgi:hypothetical protein
MSEIRGSPRDDLACRRVAGSEKEMAELVRGSLAEEYAWRHAERNGLILCNTHPRYAAGTA